MSDVRLSVCPSVHHDTQNPLLLPGLRGDVENQLNLGFWRRVILRMLAGLLGGGV